MQDVEELLSSSSNPQLVLPANIPVVIAWFEEMQAMVTVWAGVLSEKPAPKAAYEQQRLAVKTCTFCSTGQSYLLPSNTPFQTKLKISTLKFHSASPCSRSFPPQMLGTGGDGSCSGSQLHYADSRCPPH